MAKISLTKLGLKINQDVKNIEFNEQLIEVKQYLPVNSKLELITKVISAASLDNNGFLNSIRLDVFLAVEVINYYTNINFTEKQKEDIHKLYDIVISSGFYEKITNAIPEAELTYLTDNLYKITDAIYTYNNSAMGILENIAADYSNMQFDATEIQKKIANSENIELLQDILTKLG